MRSGEDSLSHLYHSRHAGESEDEWWSWRQSLVPIRGGSEALLPKYSSASGPQAKAGGKDLICDCFFRTSVLPQVRKTFYKARSSSGDILSILQGFFAACITLA
jgi:hypothetical protein